MNFYTIILAGIIAVAGGRKPMKIEGIYIRGAKPGEKIYLAKLLDPKTRKRQLLDSFAVKNDRFSIRLKNIEPGKYEIGNTAGQYISVYLDYCKTTITIDSAFLRARVGGNIADSLIRKFDGIQTGLGLTQFGLALINKKYQDEGKQLPDSLLQQFGANIEKLTAARKQYSRLIGERKDLAAAYVLANGAYAEFTVAELNDIYSKMDAYVQKSQIGANYKALLDKLNDLQIGVKAPVFTQLNTEGVAVSLADFVRGKKLVLIDFWASWCGPCRKENPNVVALYNEYRSKGFDIIGVSLDNKKEDWLKTIADDKLAWTQVSDLGGWANSVAQLYNISAVPQTFLLDGSGVIIARNLRGEELRQKINELCN